MPAIPVPSPAQALDFALDATLGTGVARANVDGEGVTKRSPFFVDLDVGAMFDNDRTSEWGLGLTFGLEGDPSVALTPQARLARGEAPWHFLLGGGIPIFVAPGTRFGVQFEGGLVFDLLESVGIVGFITPQYFFAGSDLPKDSGVLVFNFGAGVRVLL